MTMTKQELLEVFETDDLQSMIYALEDGAFLETLDVDEDTVTDLHYELTQMLDEEHYGAGETDDAYALASAGFGTDEDY